MQFPLLDTMERQGCGRLDDCGGRANPVRQWHTMDSLTGPSAAAERLSAVPIAQDEALKTL